jgi:hypothetical protein
MRLYVSLLLLALFTALLTPISAEAQASDVDCVALFDSDGTRVARVQSVNSSNLTFLKVHNGFPVVLQFFENGFRTRDDSVWFTDANCLSTAFVASDSENAISPSAIIGQDVYYADPAAVPQNVQVLSYLSEADGSCQPTNTFQDAAPVIGQFTLPQYTPPFHLEPEPCYTPSPAVAALTPYGLGAMALVLGFGAYLTMRRNR